MATRQVKKIDQRKADTAEIHKHNLGVMMPFIKFGVGAMKLIGQTLIHIVKHIPKPGHDEPKTKPGGRIIKL
ncbi:hypothetical protein ACFGVR_21695 [Mucilaginibacter sp. AW1-3]